jgi:hypothetical protein
MFGMNDQNSTNAIELLKHDHEEVKALFEKFEKSESRAEKKRIAKEAMKDLKIHAMIEEEMFYPAARKEVDEDLMNEADEEHHVAKILIAELEDMDGSESHFDSKFLVLAENVRHHIKEEEGEMLPKAEKADLDLDALGQKMAQRKQELMETEDFPKVGEEAMVAASHGRGDSPAKASHRGRSARRH